MPPINARLPLITSYPPITSCPPIPTRNESLTKASISKTTPAVPSPSYSIAQLRALYPNKTASSASKLSLTSVKPLSINRAIRTREVLASQEVESSTASEDIIEYYSCLSAREVALKTLKGEISPPTQNEQDIDNSWEKNAKRSLFIFSRLSKEDKNNLKNLA